MENLNQYHQTIREMKSAQQMVLGMILYQFFDQFYNIFAQLWVYDSNKVINTLESKKVFEAKLRDSPLDEEWCERLNEANDKVREAIESRDKLQVDHKRVTKIFQKSDRIMASYLLNQKSRIEKCQSYFELRKVIQKELSFMF